MHKIIKGILLLLLTNITNGAGYTDATDKASVYNYLINKQQI